MGCLIVRFGTHTGGMSITPPSMGSVSVDASTAGGCDIGIDVKNKKPTVTTSKVGDVKLGIYLICRTGKGNYLLVRPTETMWITVDDSIDYDIRSNTDWNLH